MILIHILILLNLALICYQDMRYRAVYWICFPVLAIVMFILKYNQSGINNALSDATYGILFLALQMLILWGYFSIKNKTLVNLTNDYLGWGDVLFLLALPFYLSPVNYILFYLGSLIAVLLYILITKAISQKAQNPHIPLAGLQAVLLLIVMTTDYFSSKLLLYDDSWILF